MINAPLKSYSGVPQNQHFNKKKACSWILPKTSKTECEWVWGAERILILLKRSDGIESDLKGSFLCCIDHAEFGSVHTIL